MRSPYEETIDTPSAQPRGWRFPFSWLGLIALAMAAYELTHSPALAAVFVCLKFGWEDFATAGWLLRADPDRWRGRSTFWLHLAWGLWKTALVAFLMSIAFAAVARRGPLPAAPAQLLRAFLGTFLTTLVGFGLATLMTFLASAFALRAGARLWLDNAVHRARRLGCFPPSPFCEGRTNRLGQLLITSLGIGILSLLCAALTAVPPGPVGGAVSFALSLAAPVAVVLCREVVAHRIWAETPQECWPDPPDNDPWRDGGEVR